MQLPCMAMCWSSGLCVDVQAPKVPTIRYSGAILGGSCKNRVRFRGRKISKLSKVEVREYGKMILMEGEVEGKGDVEGKSEDGERGGEGGERLVSFGLDEVETMLYQGGFSYFEYIHSQRDAQFPQTQP